MFRLESPTRSLIMEAPRGIQVSAAAGDMKATCRKELHLQSTEGEVSLIRVPSSHQWKTVHWLHPQIVCIWETNYYCSEQPNLIWSLWRQISQSATGKSWCSVTKDMPLLCDVGSPLQMAGGPTQKPTAQQDHSRAGNLTAVTVWESSRAWSRADRE